MTEQTSVQPTARAIWASGDYDYVARRIWDVGAHVVRATGATTGDDVLDVACGTGNAAVQAAQAGARVVGVDVAPELFEAARGHAREAGVDVEWLEGDAQVLPFSDHAFDVVLSTCGSMFAPDHARTAAEMARVLRPGGRLGIASWRQEGWIAEFFALFSAYRPPQPQAASPMRWGDARVVEDLFEPVGVDVASERHVVELRYPSVEDAVSAYTTRFGPGIAALTQARAEGRADALLADLTVLCARYPVTDGVALPADYLLTTGRKRT